MARRTTLRASDADRERIAERLRHAAGEGRLLAEELEERLERTFNARTYGELDAVVADLPGAPVHRRERPPSPPWLRPLPIIALIVLAPLLFSLLLAAAVVMATLFSTWIVVLVVGWWLFGHRYGYRGSCRRSLHAYGRWPSGRPGGPRPRPWL
jgi:hypothetical protein